MLRLWASESDGSHVMAAGLRECCLRANVFTDGECVVCQHRVVCAVPKTDVSMIAPLQVHLVVGVVSALTKTDTGCVSAILLVSGFAYLI